MPTAPRVSGIQSLLRCTALVGSVILTSTLLLHPVMAQETRTVSVNLPPQSLGTALSRLAAQAELEMILPTELVVGKPSPAVAGDMSAGQALSRVLAGSGLDYSFTGSNTVVIAKRGGDTDAVAPDGSIMLDTIMITASGAATEGSGSYTTSAASIARGADSLREVPQSVTVVTRQALDDQNLTNMSEAMAKVPGIVANREATSAPTYYSRGFKINNYQIDSLGTSYDSSFRPDFDMTIYDRVEVLRGAEGLFSGTGEPGGSVNLARKRPTDRVQSSFSLSGGSWQNRRVEADISGPLAFDGALRGRLVGAWQDREFFYSPSNERRKVLYGILEYDLGPWTTISAGISYQKQEGNKWFLGLPTYVDSQLLDFDRKVALTPDWSRASHTIKEVFAGIEHRFGSNWTLKLNAMRQEFNSDTLRVTPSGPVDREAGGLGDMSSLYERTGNHSKAVDISLNGRFTMWERDHKLLVGADWRESNAHQLGYVLDLGAYPEFVSIWNFHELRFARPSILGPRTHWPAYGAVQKGVYARAELEASDNLRFVLGGRYGSYKYSSITEIYQVDGTLVSESITGYRDNDIFTPYAAVLYDVSRDWSVYASLTDIYKAQANRQSGPVDNPSPLDPITGRNFEIGAKGELLGGALNTSVALYRIERTGEAVSDPRYPNTPDGTGSSCCYIAQGKIVSEGVDVEVSGEIMPDWRIFAGYTYNHNKDAEADQVFSALTPRHMLKLWTSYHLPGEYSRWTIGGGVTMKSKHGNNGIFWVRGDGGWEERDYEIRQGGYTVWDASVQYRLDDQWELALNVNNIFDKNYYSAIGTPTSGNWYGEPRNVALTLRGRF